MTLKQFKKILTELVKDEFVVWTNKDEHFEQLEDDEVCLCGEDENAIFAIKITKVK